VASWRGADAALARGVGATDAGYKVRVAGGWVTWRADMALTRLGACDCQAGS